MSAFGILLIGAIFVALGLVYVFCFSAFAEMVADEVFYDPLEESMRRSKEANA